MTDGKADELAKKLHADSAMTADNTGELARRLQVSLDSSTKVIENLKDELGAALQERDEARGAQRFIEPLVPGLEEEELRMLGLDDGDWHEAVAAVLVHWKDGKFETKRWYVTSTPIAKEDVPE